MNELKICTKCLQEKHLDLFYNTSQIKSGKTARCKECLDAINKKYEIENKTIVNKCRKRYRDKNKNVLNKNAVKKRRSSRLRTLANAANRVSKVKSNGESISAFDLWMVAKRQKLICPISGVRLTNFNTSIDHIIPYCKGGKNTINNIQLVSWNVNQMKNSHTTEDFLNLIKTIYLHNFKN